MKKLFLLLFPFILFANLPLDRDVLTGKLDNGLTYYIRKNALPKEHAQIKLMVNVGYFDGGENAVGIAHLIEHLTMLQTEYFADYEIIEFLNSIGAPLGADATAYTGPYQTCYEFDLPLEKTGVMEKGLQLLSGVAGKTIFSKKVTDNEKNIVLQELRERDDHNLKSYSKLFEWTSDDGIDYRDSSRCVTASTVESLREFYQRYYTADRMAIVVVGSIEPEEILQQIEEKFSYLKKGDGAPLDRATFHRPIEGKFLTYTHPEISNNYISIAVFIPEILVNSEKNLKKQICADLFTALLNERLELLKEEEGSVFHYSGAGRSSWLNPDQGNDYFRVGFVASEKFEEIAMEKVTTLFGRAVSGGFGDEAFSKMITKEIDYLNLGLKNLHRIENEDYMEIYSENFTKNLTPKDVTQTAQLKKEILANLSYEEFTEIVKEIYGNLDFFINHMGNREIDPTPLLRLLEKQNEDGELDTIIRRPLQVAALEQGEIDIHSFHLSNGMRVLLKQTDIVKDEVQVYGFAHGGTYSLCPNLYEASKIAPHYQTEASFAGLKKHELLDYLEDQKASCYFDLGNNMRTFSGNANGNNKVLFQVIQALFMEQNSNSKVLEKILTQWQEQLKLMQNNPQVRFQQELISLIYGDHPLSKQIDLSAITQKDCESIMRHAFGNPSEFTIIIVGDFEKSEMKSLIKEHLASIPQKKLSYSFKSKRKLPHPKGIEKRIFYGGDDEHATTIVHFPIQKNADPEGKVPSYFIEKIISDALFETFRHKLGISYHPYAQILSPLSPQTSDLRMHISVTTDLDNVENHLPILEGIFTELRETPPTTEKIEGIKEEFRNSNRTSFENNSAWINGIFGCVLKNKSFAHIGDLSYLDEVTPEAVHQVIKEVLDYKDVGIITWLPASYEGEQEEAI